MAGSLVGLGAGIYPPLGLTLVVVASPALFGVLLDWGLPTGLLVLTAAAALLMISITRQLAVKAK